MRIVAPAPMFAFNWPSFAAFHHTLKSNHQPWELPASYRRGLFLQEGSNTQN